MNVKYLSKKEIRLSKFKNLRAIEFDGVLYFNKNDFDNYFKDIVYEIVDNGEIQVLKRNADKRNIEIPMIDENIRFFEGETYININHY